MAFDRAEQIQDLLGGCLKGVYLQEAKFNGR